VPRQAPNEVKTFPAYTLADAARYVGTTPQTLRRWFRGRPAVSTKEGAFRRSEVKALLPTEAGPREPLSFIDLIEAHVLFSIRRAYKFPMSKIKTAMEYLAEQMEGNLMFLAHKEFYHDDSNLFLGTDKTLLSLSERGQLADKTILANGLHQIVYGTDGYADEFFPKLDNAVQREFVINPAINYGRLCLVRLGIGADVLAQRYQAGELVEHLAKDYGAKLGEIVEAIRWHDKLAA
jgi:uncharacterized protein (DUF433 family)